MSILFGWIVRLNLFFGGHRLDMSALEEMQENKNHFILVFKENIFIRVIIIRLYYQSNSYLYLFYCSFRQGCVALRG